MPVDRYIYPEDYDAPVKFSPIPTRSDYDFLGWAEQSTAMVPVYASNGLTTLKMGSSDVTLYAVWTPHIYTITYEMSGGTNNGGNPVMYTIESNTITFLAPTMSDYTFDGWYEEAAYTTPKSGISAGSTGNVKVYAKWLEDFTITFNEGAHGSITTQRIFEVADGGAFPTPPGVTADSGYTFNGWPTMPATVTEDRTFTAAYTPIEYTITYETNGGTNASGNPDKYTIETPTITFLAPTRTGYTFDGWYSDAALTTAKTGIALGSTGNVKVYAKWLEDFTITFNEGAHGSITTQRIFEVADGGAFPTPPGVTADSGYTFNGWPTMPATVTEDRTFTAAYTPIEYTITYETNGGTNASGNPDKYNDRDADDNVPCSDKDRIYI